MNRLVTQEVFRFKVGPDFNEVVDQRKWRALDLCSSMKECITVIIEEMQSATDTKADVVAAIEAIFSNNIAPVTLSTVHKAKGMEWPRVFILDSFLIGKRAETAAQQQQEDNLHYVAITRSKHTLGYINSEDYRG